MAKTISISVRLTPKEKRDLFALAEKRGVSVSEVMRRLIREAVYHGPTFFADDRRQFSQLARETSALGRNLNQIARRVNSGEVRVDPLNKEIINKLAENQLKLRAVLYEILMNSKRRRGALRKSSTIKAIEKTEPVKRS